MSSLFGRLALAALLVFGASQPARALTIEAAFDPFYDAFDLGSIAGLPPLYGGLTFKAGDPNTVIIGGQANGGSGLLYSVPVIRGAGDHITGFGAPAAIGTVGAFNDGGIAYGPGGVLFYTRFPTNELGQLKPGSTADDLVTDLSPLGIASSVGALNFVGPGFGGAGRFKVVSYNAGTWYDVTLTPDGFGTYDITTVALIDINGADPGDGAFGRDPEGFVYIDGANLGFGGVDSMLISLYISGKIQACQIDGNGDPIRQTCVDFLTGISGAEGAAIDPTTGDFLFSTFGGGDRIVRVQGFAPPEQEPTAPEPATLALVLSGLLLLAMRARRRGIAIRNR